MVALCPVFMVFCRLEIPYIYTVFHRIHAPPPPKLFDHEPEDSSPKIYMTTLFNDRFNAVLTICLLHPMK